MPLLRSCLPCGERNPTATGSNLTLCLSPFSLDANSYTCQTCRGSGGRGFRPGQVLEHARLLFEHQDALDDEHLLHYAATLGLDTERFTWELQNHVFAYRVN